MTMTFTTSGRNHPTAMVRPTEDGTLVIDLEQTLKTAMAPHRVAHQLHFDKCSITIENPAALLSVMQQHTDDVLDYIRWHVTITGGTPVMVHEVRLTGNAVSIRLDDAVMLDFWLAVTITKEQLQEIVGEIVLFNGELMSKKMAQAQLEASGGLLDWEVNQALGELQE